MSEIIQGGDSDVSGIRPDKLAQNTIIDMLMHVRGVCPERCISCGAYGENDILKSRSRVLDPEADDEQDRANVTEVTREKIEETLNRVIAGTRLKVRDLLAPFVTTDVNVEPLWTDNFIDFAELVYELTERRSAFAPKDIRELPRSKAVCISHGYTLRKNSKDQWEVRPGQEKRMNKIVKLMMDNKIPYFVLSMDVARRMGAFGAEDLIEQKIGMKRKVERIGSKLNLMKQIEEYLEKVLEHYKSPPDKSPDNESKFSEETLMPLSNAFAEFSLFQTSDIKLQESFIDASKEEIEEIDTEIVKITDSGRKEGEKIRTIGITSTGPNPKATEHLSALRARKKRVEDTLCKAEKTLGTLRSELNDIRDEIDDVIQKRETEPSTISKRIEKAQEKHDETKHRLQIIPEAINSRVIEANAQCYAKTLLALRPAVMAGKRVGISLQGDDTNDRSSPVRIGLTTSVWQRTQELLEETFRKEKPNEPLYGRMALDNFLRRLDPHEEQFYISAGRARYCLNIRKLRQNDIIPFKRYVREIMAETPTRVNRAKIDVDGRLLIQGSVRGETYNNTLLERWTQVRLGGKEQIKEVADASMAKYKATAKPRALGDTVYKEEPPFGAPMKLSELLAPENQEKIFKTFPLNFVSANKDVKDLIFYALKKRLEKVKTIPSVGDEKIESFDDIRTALIKEFIIPERVEAEKGFTSRCKTRIVLAEKLINMHSPKVKDTSDEFEVESARNSGTVLALRSMLGHEFGIQIPIPGDRSYTDEADE